MQCICGISTKDDSLLETLDAHFSADLLRENDYVTCGLFVLENNVFWIKFDSKCPFSKTTL